MAAGSLKSVSKIRLSKIFFPLLIAAGIVFNILAPLFAFIWFQQPFLGFFLFPRLTVSDTYSPNWDLSAMELQAGDILVSVDEAPVVSGRDVYLVLRQKQAGDIIALTLDQAPAPSTNPSPPIVVTLKSFPGTDLLIFFWLPYLIGIIYLALGLTVYHLRGVERVGSMFVAFCVLVSILSGGLFDQHTLHFLTPVWAFVFPLTGASLLHLSLVFPTETRLLRRRPWLGVVPYLPALLLGVVNMYSLYLTPDPGLQAMVQNINSIFLGVSVFLFFILLLNARLLSLSRQVRQQITVILWGSVIAFGPGAIWITAKALGLGVPFAWSIFIAIFTPLIFFPLMIAYAILRYRLLDLDLVFSRGVTYSLLIALVMAAYFLVVGLLAALFRDSALYQNPFLLAIFILALVLLLEPLKDRLQTIINRLFQVEQFDSRQLLQLYGRALTMSPLEANEILKLLLSHTSEALAPEQALVFLREPTYNSYTIRHHHQLGANGSATVEVQFGEHDDLVKWLASTHDILQLSPGGVPQPQGIKPEELARLHMLDISLCVPLLGSDYLLGWLALGPKKSGYPYIRSDLTFLATLASQTTIALENARFLEQANRRAAELEALQKISADIQTAVEPDQLLKSVVEQAARLLRAAGGLVFLLEPDNQTLKVVVSHNLDKDYTGSTLKAHEGMAGQIMQVGKRVVVDNYQSLPNRPAQFKEANFGAVMGVPFHWQGKVRGMLYLVHRAHGARFSKTDIWLMEFFAAQAAIALEKSQLLQEARNRATQLATLMDVSSAITSTLDLDDALQRVMDRAVQIL
ncbi:MAG: GAF domain-containing protein, partial [Chloroflexota bacterium]